MPAADLDSLGQATQPSPSLAQRQKLIKRVLADTYGLAKASPLDESPNRAVARTWTSCLSQRPWPTVPTY